MNDVDLIIADARRAFWRRRQEIAAVADPRQRCAALQTQIQGEIEIARYVVKLLAMRDVTEA